MYILVESSGTCLADTMGIGGSSSAAHTGSETRERLDLLVEDDKEDDDFDNEEDDDDDESDLAEDNDMEKRLLKEKIGKDELDALSITSGAASGSSDNENTLAHRMMTKTRQMMKAIVTVAMVQVRTVTIQHHVGVNGGSLHSQTQMLVEMMKEGTRILVSWTCLISYEVQGGGKQLITVN